MKQRSIRYLKGGLALVCLSLAAVAGAQDNGAPKPAVLKQQPAVKRHDATAQMMLAAASAGKRLVAVGDHGVVLLSDDDGRTFRQARSVPTGVTLTAVSFADEKNGWAAGHWGVILSTADGGETWTLQRSDTAVDRPLFSIHFADATRGWAVGLWSLMLATSDGGKTWNEVKLPLPPDGGKADRNLFRMFTGPRGTLFIAAERGTLLRSDDQGANWSYVNTGYKGSFWTGRAMPDGTLILAGLRGTIYRSVDDGKTWAPAKSEAKSSITDLALAADKVYAVGLDGVTLESSDRGETFSFRQREDRMALTAVALTSGGKPVIFSKQGVVGK